MLSFLTGISTKVWGLIGAALVALAMVTYLIVHTDNTAEKNQQVGMDLQQARQVSETLKQVEVANEVRNTIEEDVRTTGGSSELYDQCLRYNRNGNADACKRFLPELPASND